MSLDVLGEFIRQDITEGQEGVSVTLDVQVVDTTTCEPLADVALEAWSTNSTVRTECFAYQVNEPVISVPYTKNDEMC